MAEIIRLRNRTLRRCVLIEPLPDGRCRVFGASRYNAWTRPDIDLFSGPPEAAERYAERCSQTTGLPVMRPRAKA